MFKLVKEIRSKQGVLHFKRWEIFSLKKRNIHLYLHKIYKADEDADQHDHPWNFWSLILKGSYVEKTGGKFIYRQPGSLVHRNAEDTHKITFLKNRKPVYTLVLTHGEPRTWGYKTKKGWMDFTTYRSSK